MWVEVKLEDSSSLLCSQTCFCPPPSRQTAKQPREGKPDRRSHKRHWQGWPFPPRWLPDPAVSWATISGSHHRGLAQGRQATIRGTV